MESAEASGKTVEDALERALKDLGATREEVEMTVLDEGKRSGLFGRGKDAIVRVTRLAEGERAEPAPAAAPDTSIPRGNREGASSRPRGARERGARPAGGAGSRGGSRGGSRPDLESPQPRLREEDFLRPGGGNASGASDAPRPQREARGPRPERGGFRDRPASSGGNRSGGGGGGERRERDRDREPRKERPEVEPDINAEEVDFAAQIVDDLLQILDINGDINIREPLSTGDGRGSVRAVIDISGEDLGLLIGRRGDTLQALQYLVNLVVSRRFPETGGVTIDVEHYRHRREEQIVALAKRMADRVRQTHSPITLEPMPPAERRIIHILFVDDPEVLSSSIGEGESRKVVISPRS
jgi:spoIIIJ-associated protein